MNAIHDGTKHPETDVSRLAGYRRAGDVSPLIAICSDLRLVNSTLTEHQPVALPALGNVGSEVDFGAAVEIEVSCGEVFPRNANRVLRRSGNDVVQWIDPVAIRIAAD